MAREREIVREEEVEEVETRRDAGAGLANALIVITGVMLLVAIFLVLNLLKTHYNAGMLAGS